MELIGKTIRQYQILERLGQGGMGIVYKARDTNLNRIVALKFLPQNLMGDENARKRFLQEARAASQLDHVNICTVFEIGRAGDAGMFIAMAFYDGESLRDKLNRGKLLSEQVVDIAMQIATGLERAHQAGIVHRDIKPANIMVTTDSLVKIVDFGLAKLDGSHLTRPGSTMGTIGFMSPEQVHGSDIDHRTDIWSLGAVMYQMLSDARPFGDSSPQGAMYRIVNEPHIPLSQIDGEVNPLLEAVIDKCLEKKVEKRYQSAALLKQDLKLLSVKKVIDSAPDVSVAELEVTRGTTKQFVIGVLIIAVIAVLISLFFVDERPWWWPGGGEPESVRIAVLPFQISGMAPISDDFSSGLLHTVTSKLTAMERFKGTLSVIPASEVLSEKIRNTRDAETMFNADLVVSGSILGTSDGIQFAMTLIDVETRAGLRSETINAPPDNLLAFQDQVVRKLASLLEVELTPRSEQSLSAGGTKTSAAFSSYTSGLGILRGYENLRDIEAAIRQFERAIVEDPGYTLAYAALGEAYWRKYGFTRDRRWVDQAIQHAQKAVSLGADQVPVLVTMGIIYKGSGEYRKAAHELKRALDFDPQNAAAHLQMAATYYYLNQPDSAEFHYRMAIQLKPDNWRYYNSLGFLYQSQGLHFKAAEQYKQVVKLKPHNPTGFNNLGAQYEKLDRYDEALTWYEKAVEANPSDSSATATAYGNLAGIYYRKNQFLAAARVFERARALAPEISVTWRDLGNSYYFLDRKDEANRIWQEIIALESANLDVNPNLAESLETIAEAYARTGQTQRAKSTLARLEKNMESNWRILFGVARTYELLGNRSKALFYLEKALQNGLSQSSLDYHSASMRDFYKDSRYQELLKKYPPRAIVLQ